MWAAVSKRIKQTLDAPFMRRLRFLISSRSK
jgi:hypothetical protein